MKAQKLFDVSINYLTELSAQSFGESLTAKAVAVGAVQVLRLKGPKWFTETLLKSHFESLQKIGLYSPETQDIDSVALFGFLDGYVSQNAPLEVLFLKVPAQDLKIWVNKLKEADNGQKLIA